MNNKSIAQLTVRQKKSSETVMVNFLGSIAKYCSSVKSIIMTPLQGFCVVD
jgi:hypothetical protein